MIWYRVPHAGQIISVAILIAAIAHYTVNMWDAPFGYALALIQDGEFSIKCQYSAMLRGARKSGDPL